VTYPIHISRKPFSFIVTQFSLLLSSLCCEALQSIYYKACETFKGPSAVTLLLGCKSKSILWSTQAHIHLYTQIHETSHEISQRKQQIPLPPTQPQRTLRIRQKLKMLQICNPCSKRRRIFHLSLRGNTSQT